MKRTALKFAAVIGATALSALAVAPAFAAAATSQATAQSLNLAIGGNTAISQKVTATNDGTTETKNSANTLPTIASVLPGNNLISAGVAPQQADANSNGTSFACAGIAGQGSTGAVVSTGRKSCDIDGSPLTIDLAHLDLGHVILGSDSALGNALKPIIDPLNTGLLDGVINQVVAAVTSGLQGTPLGQVKVGGSLSAIEGTCAANPDKATGTAHLVDSSGGSNATPIGVTIPTGTGSATQTLSLLNLPANPPPNTHVLVNLDTVTATLLDAIKVELRTALGGALSSLAGPGQPLEGLLTQVQTALIVPLVANLQPLLQQLQANILDITLNKQSTGHNGRSIDVTALDAQVLPAAQQFTGSSLISGQLGRVTCGPNTRADASQGSASNPKNPKNNHNPHVPTVVDSGLRGHEDHTARNVLGATAALMLLAGTAGLVGYRRMLNK